MNIAEPAGAVQKPTTALRSLTPQPTSNQAVLSNPAFFFSVYGGAAGACNACHPPLTTEALIRQSQVRAKEMVKTVALELMQEHRRKVVSAQKSYSKDERGNELDPIKRQSKVDQAVAAARAIEELNKLDRQLYEEEAGLRALGARARRAGSDFDPGWIGELWNLVSRQRDQKIEAQFSAFEDFLRMPHRLRRDANSALQLLVDDLEKWRIRQRYEVALNLGVLYKQFPFFGTHILPSLLVRVADMPRGTVVPPENQIAMGFATLLANIDDVMERITSDELDPLKLPEAVRIAAKRMQFSELVALQELLDEKKRQEDIEFLLSLALPLVLAMLPLLGAVAVSATGVAAAADIAEVIAVGGRAAAAAEGIELAANTAAAIAGGIMFLSEAEETLNRFALEAASGSHDRSLLGVPALSGGDAMMIAINGILTAAGLFGAALGIQTHAQTKGASTKPPEGSAGPSSIQGKRINELSHQVGTAPPPVSDARPKAMASGKSIEELHYEVGMAKLPVSDAPPKAQPARGGKAPVPGAEELPDAAAIDWLERNNQSQPPWEQPQLYLPKTSVSPTASEYRVAAPKTSYPTASPKEAPLKGPEATKAKVTESDLLVGSEGPAPIKSIDEANEAQLKNLRGSGTGESGSLDSRAQLRESVSEPGLSRKELVRRTQAVDLLTGDGNVYTRADFPELEPNPLKRPKAAPPRRHGNRSRVGRSKSQNIEVKADKILLEQAGVDKNTIKITQRQSDMGGKYAGANLPDVQATLPDGRRIHIEYDRAPPERALGHAIRILENDPEAIVILKVVDFD